MNLTSLHQTVGGQYPQPFESLEIDAVRDSVANIRGHWAYFQQRYGDMGLLHQIRDQGYLVTLTAYHQSTLNQQVQWLATVLASRGIPSYFLARSLTLLHDALAERQPLRAYAYAKLTKAATMLDQERLAVFSENQLMSFRNSLSLARECNISSQEAATLLMSAIADEKNARYGTLDSVMGWLGNRQHFSAAWCDELDIAVKHVRAMT